MSLNLIDIRSQFAIVYLFDFHEMSAEGIWVACSYKNQRHMGAK